MRANRIPLECEFISRVSANFCPFSFRQRLISLFRLVPLNHRVFRTVTGGHLNNLKPYISCRHPGECSTEVNCICRKESRMCNKYCGCSTDCRHRFPGCRCKPGNCRTNQCQCFFALWECDPDMCHSCNCDGAEETNKPICKNINIQRCLQRKLYIAPSDVAGTGCFAGEFIPKGEYIGEYVGEIISQQEAERRGKIYDKFKCSYLFSKFTFVSTRFIIFFQL